MVFGKGAPQTDEGDLWRLVNTPPPSASADSFDSFEEALRKVDSSLEALVGQSPARNRAGDVPVEATIEGDSPPTSAPASWEDDDLGDPNDPDAAKARRQRLLKRAMDNLGALPHRPGVSGAQATPVPAGPANAQTQRELPPVNVPAPTPADLDLAARIEDRFLKARKKDHFGTLGLNVNTTRDQVKAAFLDLAKTYHPDRLPPSLPHLAAKMSTVFEAIREAYDTLYDDARRLQYIKTAMAASAAPAPAAPPTEAADAMRLGETMFKKRDFRQAEQNFARAHALDKAGVSLAAQAWAIYMDPTRKAEAPAARELMKKALVIDPRCDRAHYQLGVIARVEGDLDAAERSFRKCMEANPRHLEANQELRLIEMRKKKAQDGKKGFFR